MYGFFLETLNKLEAKTESQDNKQLLVNDRRYKMLNNKVQGQ